MQAFRNWFDQPVSAASGKYRDSIEFGTTKAGFDEWV
jgi:hypothetical protein